MDPASPARIAWPRRSSKSAPSRLTVLSARSLMANCRAEVSPASERAMAFPETLFRTNMPATTAQYS
jgi:hypothetical protein